ncbi:MAG: twin-arginine translocase TatA/TatE family subunit [Rhodospirillaceae bacterium]|nr:twin-arginine translocase TatA/TatE family subunit [Rhodospirillaceae bacterium]
MGSFSIWHLLIVLVVVLVLFGGGGKLSKIMGDLGAGIKDFKKNIKDGGKEDPEVTTTAKTEDKQRETLVDRS